MFALEEIVSEEGMTQVVSSIFASLVTISLLVFSPLPMIWRQFRKTALDDCHLYPLIACFLYNIVWSIYTITLDRYDFYYMCQFYCSEIGVHVFFMYCLLITFATAKLYERICLAMIFCCMLHLTLLCISICNVNKIVFNFLLRSLVMVCGICMYASPLSTIENCRKANVVSHFPSWLCCAFLLNGASWVIIAFLVSEPDLIVTVTNGIGAVLALIQLGIIHKFCLKFSNSSEVVDPHNDTKFVSFFKYLGNFYIISALVVVIAVLCGYIIEPLSVSKFASSS